MQIVPFSNGEDNCPDPAWLREFNKCHDVVTGRFCRGAAPSPGERDAAKGRIRPETPERFKQAIGLLRGRARRSSVSDYSVKELALMKLFTLQGGKAGYAIKGGDELVNVFNAGGEETLSAGSWLVLHAIEHGARRLDCFDNRLPQFYARFGFKEVRREANWTPGEPDVVFMEWRGGDPTTVRARFNKNRRIDPE